MGENSVIRNALSSGAERYIVVEDAVARIKGMCRIGKAGSHNRNHLYVDIAGSLLPLEPDTLTPAQSVQSGQGRKIDQAFESIPRSCGDDVTRGRSYYL